MPSCQRPRTACLVAGGALLLLLAGLLPAGATPAEAAPAPQGVGARFTAFESAWRGGNAAGVAALMSPTGTARYTLLAYPLSGKSRSMKPAQTRVSLAAYFKRLAGIQLRDRTPKEGPASVRIYDFSYKPARENTRTTRLLVQMRQERTGAWVLASVTESVTRRG